MLFLDCGYMCLIEILPANLFFLFSLFYFVFFLCVWFGFLSNTPLFVLYYIICALYIHFSCLVFSPTNMLFLFVYLANFFKYYVFLCARIYACMHTHVSEKRHACMHIHYFFVFFFICYTHKIKKQRCIHNKRKNE